MVGFTYQPALSMKGSSNPAVILGRRSIPIKGGKGKMLGAGRHPTGPKWGE